MRKLITLAFALLCMVSAFAADVDIIIKTNSEKIEAIIQEVSSKEIRYKKANNPNGPLFVIDLEEVSAIMYANGDVQSIEHKAKSQQNVGYNYYGAYAGNTGPMKHIKADEYMIEGRHLKGKELNFFLQQNCPIAYEYHKKWQGCEIAGWTLMGSGIAIFFAGIAYSFTVKNVDWRPGTYAICTVGGSLIAGSIPLIVCGNVYKKKTAEVFNVNCGQPQAFQPELRLQSSSNGLGLALSF